MRHYVSFGPVNTQLGRCYAQAFQSTGPAYQDASAKEAGLDTRIVLMVSTEKNSTGVSPSSKYMYLMAGLDFGHESKLVY